ncbi:MAG: hypothetical protein AAF573_09890 [Bacteroidota bacterium]
MLTFRKYQWIEIDLKKRKKQEFRPESYSPVNPDLSDIKKGELIKTQGNWAKRKEYCLTNVYTSIDELIADSRAPTNKSLATFKPTKVKKLIIEEGDREWKKAWTEARKQLDMFAMNDDDKKVRDTIIDKIPYKFKYHFVDSDGKDRKLMIEDWEIGALYRNCLKNAQGDEKIALDKVREKYEDEFIKKKDQYFFLGTTYQNHLKRYTNPFVIIGVFYPKKEKQLRLF